MKVIKSPSTYYPSRLSGERLRRSKVRVPKGALLINGEFVYRLYFIVKSF